MDDTNLIITQKKLKLLLGGLGVALPTLLYLGNLWVYGNEEIRVSMSNYYHSPVRDIFVGILFSIGLFLVAYNGYGLGDRILSTIGGIFMIMIALFPTTPVGQERDIIGIIHLLSAAGAYVILAIFSLFLFTKTNPQIGPKTGRKRIRNFVYYISGIIIVIALVLLIISENDIINLPIENSTFWLEYAANSAFGTAWLVKGEGIFLLNDDPILRFDPWETFGLLILISLAAGSGYMIFHIFFL